MALANQQRGQLGFEIDVEGEREPQRYVFAFTTNALCAIEEEFDLESISDLETVLGGKTNLRQVRTLFRLGLTDFHPQMTDFEAGNLMEAIGGLEPSLELVMRAIETAFPEAAKNGNKGPRTAPGTAPARGTGRSSTSRGAKRG